jgi:hypothetical protein
VWDLISFFLILGISLYIPFVFAFDIDTSVGGFYTFELFLDCWFLFEIIMNFFTGYVEKGILIMDRKKIFKKYVKTWFFIDMISSFPFSFITLGSDGTNSGAVLQSTKLIRILRLAKYARLLRLIRFLKVNKFLATIEELIVSESASVFLKFIKLAIELFFITHWVGCMLYISG